MPRRPRPATRVPPRSTNRSLGPKHTVRDPSSSSRIRVSHTKFSEESEDNDALQSDRSAVDLLELEADRASSNNGSDDEGEGADLPSDQDAEGPRFAQWMDEVDALDVQDGNESDPADSSDHDNFPADHGDLEALEGDLSALPFGALRKAHRSVMLAGDDSESSDTESKSERVSGEPSRRGNKKEKETWEPKPRKDINKRSNKHAPIEVTSKKPVTRRRMVVDVKAPQPRDPRFLSVAGQFSSQQFQKSYSFLSEMHTDELKTLRENVKRARKLLVSSPRNLRDEREEEVKRLELAVKRAESTVNKDTRDRIEQEALNTAMQEEKQKRKQGKGHWWMKDSEKKTLMVQARYQTLAASGGQKAVRKAIEKKQKKVSQKEKKSRPFAKSQRGDVSEGWKRSLENGLEKNERSSKRRKLDTT